jgi:hypothetical protein
MLCHAMLCHAVPCHGMLCHAVPCCGQVSLESRGPEGFKTPKGVCVPFGSMELALSARPPQEQQRFAALLAASEEAGLTELDGIADEMQVCGSTGGAFVLCSSLCCQ